MNILKNNQYVSIPRQQYEEMEKIVNEKKDIIVNFCLSFWDKRYNNNSKTIWSNKLILELNDKINIEELDLVVEMIDSACNEVAKTKNEEIDSLSRQLAKIESKWWYKLFGG